MESSYSEDESDEDTAEKVGIHLYNFTGKAAVTLLASSSSSSSLSSPVSQVCETAKVPTILDLTKDSESEDEENERQNDLVQLFKIQSKIVGKRFYKEKLNDGELVYLEREPRNAYDRNAIVVQSINRQQVGHISAGSSYPNIAASLSPIMDYKLLGGAGALTEAVSIPWGNSSFSSQCQIILVGVVEHKSTIQKHLETCKVPFMDMITSQRHLGFVDMLAGEYASLQQQNQVSVKHRALTAAETISSMDDLWISKDDETAKLHFEESEFPALKECMLTRMFKHQLVGVGWMLDREKVKSLELPPFYEQIKKEYVHSLTKHADLIRPRSIKGGILADTMGMGKSLMLLGLIVSNPPPGRTFCKTTAAASSSSSSFPSIVEEEETVDLKSMKIPELKAILSKVGAKVGGNKDELIRRIVDIGCNSKSVSVDMSTDSTVGLQQNKLEADMLCQSRQPTLIVCPMSVLSSWQDQIATHMCEGSLNVLTYHGASRKFDFDVDELSQADVVLTTYDVLSLDSGPVHHANEVESSSSSSLKMNKRKASQNSPLFDIRWWRIILDEVRYLFDTIIVWANCFKNSNKKFNTYL